MQEINANKERIIVILPAYNEEGKIGNVVSKIKNRAHNLVNAILVVDDGSSDMTAEEAKENGAIVIVHKKNSGVGAAIRTGIDYALEIDKGYNIVVIMGGDDQDDPAEMPRLLTPIIEEGYDFVQGSRYLKGGKQVNIPKFRWVTTILYSLFFRMITGFPVTDGTNGYRAFRISIFNDRRINVWQDWLNKYELEPYIFYKAIKLKYKVTEAPVTKFYPKNKKIGYTKMKPFMDWWRISKPLFYLWLGVKR
jgi:dolichol-phosphate mannosyltransferase